MDALKQTTRYKVGFHKSSPLRSSLDSFSILRSIEPRYYEPLSHRSTVDPQFMIFIYLTCTLYACVHLISLKIVSKIKFNRVINSRFEKNKKKKKKGIYREEASLFKPWRCVLALESIFREHFANIIDEGEFNFTPRAKRSRNERENIRAKWMVVGMRPGAARWRNRNEHVFRERISAVLNE